MARRPYADSSRTFDPSRPVVVRRALHANGRKYKVGDAFDWKHMAINPRRVRLMFNAGKLTHTADSAPKEQQPSAPSKSVATEAGPVQVQKPDELDDINDMSKLREIAEAEGARTTTSKALQRKYIREHRAGTDQTEVSE
jgi:hypothetical protein